MRLDSHAVKRNATSESASAAAVADKHRAGAAPGRFSLGHALRAAVAGVLMGIALSDLLEQVTRVLETYTPRSAIVYALVMAGGIGIVSGIYPAIRASRLDPVEALRYE